MTAPTQKDLEHLLIGGRGRAGKNAAASVLLQEGRLAEQRHQVEEDPQVEAEFRRLAVEHPERCTPSAGWRPASGGGA